MTDVKQATEPKNKKEHSKKANDKKKLNNLYVMRSFLLSDVFLVERMKFENEILNRFQQGWML